MTTSLEAAATAGWLEANLAAVAEFNAARKILMHQLEVASIGQAGVDDLRATAVELQPIALLLRALPPVPNAVVESELRAGVDEFASAVADIMRSSQDQSLDDPALSFLQGVAVHLLRANAHYRAATRALHETVAVRVGPAAGGPSAASPALLAR